MIWEVGELRLTLTTGDGDSAVMTDSGGDSKITFTRHTPPHHHRGEGERGIKM